MHLPKALVAVDVAVDAVVVRKTQQPLTPKRQIRLMHRVTQTMQTTTLRQKAAAVASETASAVLAATTTSTRFRTTTF
jgi:hypothetical protein